tara:strand:- start:1741 stop:2355 length:615 start_codon:yes stop_codon:yes gene_type:complete
MSIHVSGLTAQKKKEIEKLTGKTLTRALLRRKDVFPLLSKETQMHLQYNPKPVTNRYVKRYVEPLVENVGIITGSYRRQLSTLNDVDIVLHPGKRIQQLVSALEEKYKIFIYSRGKEKASMIVVKNKKAFKIDVWKSTKQNYIYMVMYTTGSAQHNIILRAIAKRKHMLLNQNGLYKGKKLLKASTESDVYRHLDKSFVEPQNR